MEHQRTAIVTGAYGAIGKAISRGLAEMGYRLVLAGRNADALKALQHELLNDTGNADISHETIDLSRKYQIEAFSKKWDGPLHVLAAHPGDVNSRLSNNLGYGGSESPEQGAETPLYCATDKSLRGLTGKYFEHMKQVQCPFYLNRQEVEELYAICMKY